MSEPHSLLPIALWVCGALGAPGGLPAQGAAGPHAEPALTVGSAKLEGKLNSYFTSVARTLHPRPQAVLRRIPDRARRMLAVAEYLRRRHLVDTLWTWSARETRTHQKSESYRLATTELRRVKRTFATLNPGYVLVADTNGRGLPAQIAFWNRERSVAAAAQELYDSSWVWLADETYPGAPDSAALDRFLHRLAGYAPARHPTVAVPGLSLHGQIRAFDFAVLRRGRLVAGTLSTTVDSVWDGAGWTDRLKKAVIEAGARFDGPLESPREPWHYERTDSR
jgi:hypothetical protein